MGSYKHWQAQTPFTSWRTRAGLVCDSILPQTLGNNTFVFDTKLNATTNVDTISDFTSGDILSFSAKVFAKLKGDTDLSDNIYIQTIVSVSTQDANDYLVFDLETGHLSYDADGSGIKAAVQFGTLTGVTSLTASDLHIV